jgi:class 3 adenylate cyclase
LGAERVERRLAAILTADVAGYSRLMERDEDGTLARLRSLRRDLIDPKIAEHKGRIVKTTGDGLLVEFQSVVEAVACAVALQRDIAAGNDAAGDEEHIQFRIGINSGDVIVEDGDIHGDGVNIAARLEGIAEPGGICVSGLVHDQVQGRLDCAFESIREQSLKNIARSVRVYRIALTHPAADAPGSSPLPQCERGLGCVLRISLEEVPAFAPAYRALVAYYAGGDVGATGAAGSAGTVLDRAVCALPAFGEGAGRHSGRDVRARGVDAQEPALAKAGVKAVTEALCGHSFSVSAISAVNKSLDKALHKFAERRLDEPFPYLILDARYEKVREGGIICSQAVLIAVAVDGEGRRQVLAVELANRESRSSWRDFMSGLKQRSLFGVEFVVSDDHEGLKGAIREVLPGAAWQRCYVHLLRNALDYVPRRVDDDCLQELRGFMIDVTSPRSVATSPNGWVSGRPNMPSCATGLRTISRKR